MTTTKTYSTVSEAAEVWRVDEESVRRAIREGRIPSRKVTGKVLIPTRFVYEEDVPKKDEK